MNSRPPLVKQVQLASFALATTLLVGPFTSYAHEGHDHGEPSTVSAPAAPGAPRVEAVSEQFEVLGIVAPGRDRLTLYVDRYADNQPADISRLEIEAGERRLDTRPAGPGRFEAEAPWLDSKVELELTLTLSGKDGDDLLLLTLPAHTEHTDTDAPATTLPATGIAGGLALLAGIAWWLLRRRRTSHPLAAWLFLIGIGLGSTQASSAFAHGGEDHTDEEHVAAGAVAPESGGERPQRLPDGSVFLPKPAQRALAMRTVIARSGEHRTALELAGRVIADPARGGLVQAPFSGRIEAPAGGLPQPGQAVRRGTLLAWLTPTGSGMERAGARGQAAELQAQLAVAEKRAIRLQALEGSIPQKEIEAAGIEANSLRQRLDAVKSGLSGQEALRAPVDGIVGDARIAAGQIVDARETLYEIVDPRHLMVEALAYEALPGGAVEASGLAGRNTDALPLRLTFAGAARSLREQALPLRFRIALGKDEAPPLLAIGQPIRVYARVGRSLPGFALPAAAIVRGTDNQPRVWLHVAAERYEARRVEVRPLDAERVLVTQGLVGGERIVTIGAALLAQIR